MTTQPLNGPLETGLRALAILTSAFPEAYDIDSLAFFDYSLLHSEEFGGPESLHPDVPNHTSEITVKRDLLELGLQVMIRARLVTLQIDRGGISYAATDNAPGFVDLLESSYMHQLRRRADWVVEAFGNVGPAYIRERTSALGRWSESAGPTPNYDMEASDE
ncbi:ABC-three component system middle component 2 [Nonomuraea sp. NPDC051191]|uniref:ABC-three component system middle component 2 n=1 Tax=Nonomuraea sp. NPDC051191 TaxID=3364372 RepID=UPI00378FFEB4